MHLYLCGSLPAMFVPLSTSSGGGAAPGHALCRTKSGEQRASHIVRGRTAAFNAMPPASIATLPSLSAPSVRSDRHTPSGRKKAVVRP
jgi:hypothetical protein